MRTDAKLLTCHLLDDKVETSKTHNEDNVRQDGGNVQ